MTKELWIVRYVFESLVGKDQYVWIELAKHYIIDVVFMPYQRMNRTWNNPCELDHIGVR
jgi:hypothetical protein